MATPAHGERAVSVRTSRFDMVAVEFRYADGHVARQAARSGDYGSYWRIGGTLLFEAPARPVPLTSVAVGVRGAHWESLLNAHLVTSSTASSRDLASMLIGAALALLLLSTVANIGVGAGLRRPEPLWNAAWAACVLGWALAWTHVALYVVPVLAGTSTARLITFFATAAIACAGGHLLAAATGLPRWVRRLLVWATIAVLVAGFGTAVAQAVLLPHAATLFNVAVLGFAAAVLIACTKAWKDRASGVRHFAYSFAVPIAAVLWTIVSDRGLTADDANGMYLVLLACALQTVWLALATAKRVWVVRQERDAALASEARMASIAETDPLTGLLNRRGFISRAEKMIAQGQAFTLVLLDLDRFKSINDTLGHEAGDAVLCAVARALRRMPETAQLVVGRLGGEEFGIAVESERAGAVLLAERLRVRLANLPISINGSSLGVTASFGVASAAEDDSWAMVYRAADHAMYRAKGAGRNRVELDDKAYPQAA